MIGEAVQTSKGLKRFFFVFCICALSGIFANKFIQKTIQAHWVGLNEQMQQQNISVATPRVVFARYGLPTFGAWVDTVSWRKPEDCRELRMLAKNIFVPIPFFELLISRAKAGAISVSELIVEHKADPSCHHGPLPITPSEESDWQATKDFVAVDSVPSSPSSAKRFTTERLERHIADMRKWRKKIPFSKLEIKSIVLQNINASGKMISGQGEGVVTASDVLQLDFQFRPFAIQKDKKSISTKLSLSATVADDDIRSKVDWSYDEGHLLWTSHLDKSNAIESQFLLSNLPLSVVNRWLSTPWTFQFLWANCDLKLVSSLKHFEKDQWSASNCAIKGPQGEVQVTNVSLQSLLQPTNLKVDVMFKDFKVDGVVKGSSELPLSGVFKKFGTLTGGIFFREKEMTSKLAVLGSEIVFSKNNRRTLQEVNSLAFKSSYIQKKWLLELIKVDFKDGSFEGRISAEYDKATQKWVGSLKVDELAFSKNVQDIMLGGNLSPMRLNGDVILGEGKKIEKLDLRGEFKEGSMEGVSFSEGLFFADHNDDGVRLGVSIGKMDIPRGPQTDWLFVSLLDRASITEKISLSRMHSEATILSGKLMIKKVMATALNGKLSLSGEYSSGLQEGTLDWNLPKYQYQWEWVREDGQVSLIPQSESMREWLRINKDFSKEFQGVRILSQKENKGS